MDKYGINGFDYHDNNYVRYDKSYMVTDLIELSKQYDVFDMPLVGIDIGIKPWGDMTIKDLVYHVRRIGVADMSFPIILDDTGFVCDGWHRIAKALMNGDDTIKAVRLLVMPDPV